LILSKFEILVTKLSITYKMRYSTILLLTFLTFATSISAYSQIHLGIKGGINLADMNGRIDGIKDSDTKVKLGFNVGGIMNYSFTDVFILESGLILESKGYEYRFDNNGAFSSKAEYGKLVTNVLYLDIPINLKAYFDLGNTKFYGLFGPYLGFALSGKLKSTGDLKSDLEELGLDTEENLEFGGSASNDNLKGYDFGLMLGLGVAVEDFEIGLSYDLGLVNILPGGDGDNYIKNGVFKVTVGYLFQE
jgi:hypothetical protein